MTPNRFTQAAEKLGFANYQDVNDPSMPTLGCFRIHHTVDRNGERSSTFTAYLPKQFVLDHENLHICTRGLVRKVNISASSTGELEAVGVVLQSHERGSPSVSIVARKEVILAAGALSTPQLLLLRLALLLVLHRLRICSYQALVVSVPRNILQKSVFHSSNT